MFIFPQIHPSPYILLLLLTLTGCQQVQSSSQLLEPLPQDPSIQVYFNNSQSSKYTEAYRQKSRFGDDLEKQIVDTISQAKSTIDIAVQELRLPKVAQILAEKQKSGVKVRLILEHNYSRPWSSFTSAEIANLEKREQERYQDFRKFVDINKDNQITSAEISQRDSLAIVQDAQIPWIDDTADGSKGSRLMHHKFVVVDHRFVIITSANFTLSDTSGDFTNSSSLGNANNLLKVDSPELAKLITEEFNIMWGERVGGKLDSKFGLQKPLRKSQTITLGNSKITVNFSPISPTEPWGDSANGLISKTLSASKKTVDLALFVFSDQQLANILEERHNQNVQVRALIEPQFAYRSYSEALDMMGFALSENCKYEVDNRPWKNPISTVGVPILAKGDLLHHKFAVIDNQTVITGSHNWSEAANNGNDEILVVIENPTVAAHYQREFDRLYSTIKPGLTANIQAKIDQQIKQCPQIQKPSSLTSSITHKINLNTATQAELETLPGVGKKLSERIIIARQQQKFTSLQDVDKIPGISAKILAEWEEMITLTSD
ncbi:MAG: competence protein ComE [Aphanizomenon flos-aquae MDT14a]|nr:MAG: competence protein ComE [Aphanizomenon flos-aquae MDT14a]